VCCQILLVCTVLPVHMCKCKMGPDLQITNGFGTWHLQIWAEKVAKLHESACNVWELAGLWSPTSVGQTHIQTHATNSCCDLCFPSLTTETSPTRRTGRLSTVIPFSLHDEEWVGFSVPWFTHHPYQVMTLIPSLSPTQPGAHLMCTPSTLPHTLATNNSEPPYPNNVVLLNNTV